MTIKIYTDIPVPTGARADRTRKYPFVELRVGECFIVPVEDLPPKGLGSIKAAVYAYKRGKDVSAKSKKFVVREIDHGDVGVWRIA